MPIRISQVLNIPAKTLAEAGVFNGFVDIDSQLYLDPHLLAKAETPELRGAHDDYCAYFAEVLRVLRACQERGDRMFREGVRRLMFREVPYVALGYAKDDTQGSGIGQKLASQLAETALQIIRAGIDDPTIFDLVGLIEENVGADRISDMTSRIIMPRLLSFSVRVAKELGVPTAGISFKEIVYQVPRNSKVGRPLILLPREILRTLPVARDWSDRDLIVAENTALRMRVNGIIGDTWKRATRQTKKRDLRDIVLNNPELLHDLLKQYKAKPAASYDFERDPEGLFSWTDVAAEFAQRFPLALGPVSPHSILATVTRICEHFGNLVENNGLSKLFYDGNRELRHEQYPQLLFYGIADAFCTANDLDLSREPNGGRRPVDFKISRGATAKVAVELMYSSNRRMVHGYETQLPIYDRAEKTTDSIFLILRTSDADGGISRVRKMRENALAQGKRAPLVLVFDARLGDSASKARPDEEGEGG